MGQVTIYLENEVIRKITHIALSENLSVSKWIKSRIVKDLDSNWPKDYFVKVCGSLADDKSFDRPEQARTPDIKRNSL